MLQHWSSILLLFALPSAASAAALPHVSAEQGTDHLEREGKWWAHLGDHVYHAPPSSSGLSSRVGDYYYAFGSEAAVPAELRERRVGGQGRLHIFHLPEGSAMLQTENMVGNRRSTLSDLTPLKDGLKVSHTFPEYHKNSEYKNPLDEAAQKLESDAVGRMTEPSLMEFLRELTSFTSRSFQNSEASANVQTFLQKKFAELGYRVCLHSFSHGGPATNIVAYVPGSTNGSEVVVIGAHYDDIPAYGKAPGAEDNGSGVAALMGIMRAFHEAKLRTKRNVAFVAFAGEEPGLLGSDAYAESILTARTNMESCLPAQPGQGGTASFLGRASGRRTRDMYKAIVMDEVGWQSTALQHPTVNLESYDWTQEIMDHLKQSSDDHNGPENLLVVHSNHPFGSDHMSFLRRKIPAVLTINGDDEAYPFYHSSGDKIENVDASLMLKIAKMNMGGLLRMAGLES